MSLRERKKQKTAESILAAAGQRFASEGIEASLMEEIAADAEVSVGTLYNYFGSKQALILALFESNVEEMLETGGAAASHDQEPIQAVHHLFGAYLDVMFEIDQGLLREVLRFSLGGDAAVRNLAELDGQMMVQLGEVLASHQQSGRLHKSLRVDDAVSVLYAVLISEILVYLSLDLDPPTVRDNVARRLEIAINGMKSEK